jgi:UDP-galactopyranose mutase
MKKYDYIVVGCGLYGSAIAERMRDKGKSVLIIEKRSHIGGNCYSFEYPVTNIEVHKYGTHIFHTNNKKVWDYIGSFGEFSRYHHRVLITHKGKVYSMPVNLGTINAFYGINLKPAEVELFLDSKRENIRNPANLEEKAISLIGRALYEAFIKDYSIKQWGCDPKELPVETISRLPVKCSYNDGYFDDYYQGVPREGYAALFKRMLKGISVELNTDFFEKRDYWLARCKKLVYTGPIDRYFDYCLGRLKWRSVRLQAEKLCVDDFQGTSVMNYADKNVPWTRIHEPKHLHPEKKHTFGTSVIMREYPCSDEQEPYYPVNSSVDKQLLARYEILLKKEKKAVLGGRLAEYKYYNMAEVLESALKKVISI